MGKPPRQQPGPAGRSKVDLPFHFTLRPSSDALEMDAALRPELERCAVEEAFRRGADEVQVYALLRALREPAVSGPPALNRLSFGVATQLNTDFEFAYTMSAEFMVASARAAYISSLQAEFESLREDVRDAFAFENSEPFEYYRRIRPVYYNAGYDDPADAIFRRIEPARLLGKPIGGGVHEKFAELLPRIESTLNQWAPGLAAAAAGPIHSVGGFVPRFIAPKKGAKKACLSNHAFGLAVDIDADTNPQFKEQDDIDSINWVVRSLRYDYSKRFLDKPPHMEEMEWVAQTHLLAERASEVVKQWVQQYLPVYQEVFQTEQLEGQHTGKKHNAALTRAEADKLMNSMAQKAGKPGECRTLDAATQENIDKMRVLHKYHGFPRFGVLAAWGEHGIQTVPLYLAAAFGKLGFRWGQTYEKSKDAMHFELLNVKVLPPDSSPRSLDELFPSPAQPPAKVLKKLKAQKMTP